MGDMLIIKGDEVASILEGQEKEVIQIVRDAYIAHAQGESALPHSTLLPIPTDPQARIMALPAFLGANVATAGVKWVSSFPKNIYQNMERASAVIVLNSIQTGMPLAILEGSIINAKRTAASAALAASTLHSQPMPTQLGIIGCGLINFEIMRAVRALYPQVQQLVIFDMVRERAEQFKEKCLVLGRNLEILIVQTYADVLKRCSLVSLATNAGTPYITSLADCSSDSVLLHISLRDIDPHALLACDNIVDDVDHVLRAQTSLHRAQQLVGGHEFIRCALADILLQRSPARKGKAFPVVFSPFGLGVLDIAVSKYVYDQALYRHQGMPISGFFPAPWTERVTAQAAVETVEQDNA